MDDCGLHPDILGFHDTGLANIETIGDQIASHFMENFHDFLIGFSLLILTGSMPNQLCF